MAFASNVVRPIDDIKYSDPNLYLDGSNIAELVFDADSVNNSILTILDTPIGSRVFNRSFGSDIQSILFDPMDSVTENRLRSEIVEKISLWETRIQLVRAVVLADLDNAQYYAELEYIIPSLNNQQVSFKFNLRQN